MTPALSTETVQRIEEILQTLDSQNTREMENRRNAKRLNLRISVRATVFMHNTTPNVRVYTRNISTSGIGLVTKRVFRSGELFVLEFILPDRPAKMLLAKTKFCRYLSGGLYELGAEFVESALAVRGRGQIPPHWYELAGVSIPSSGCVFPAKNKQGDN